MCLSPCGWNLEREPRAASFLRVHPHPATHLAYEAMGNAQTEPSALRLTGLVEHREDPLALGRRDADTLVRDRDLDRAVAHLGGHDDAAAARRVLHGVRDQVVEH